jgi:hypothetical protein
MKRLLLTLLAASVLAACAGQPRNGPPAPVESSRSARAAAPVQQAEPKPEEPAVEVYAYRPPSSAPDAPPPPPEQPAESDSTGSMVALPTEPAQPRGTGAGPATEAPSPAIAAAAPVTVPPVVAYAPPPPSAPSMSAAADNLANQAERQRQAGDYVGAAATLERALRIRPQEAYLWNRLARVRMEQGQHGQAGNLAARSNALAKDQSDLKRDNWSMIAVSRRVAGDAAGAAEAEQKARDGG